jgi:hypothetical protein
VGERHGAADLDEQLEACGDRQAPAVGEGVDRLAVDVLRHRVGLAAIARGDGDEPRDVGVVVRVEDVVGRAKSVERELGIGRRLGDRDRHALVGSPILPDREV